MLSSETSANTNDASACTNPNAGSPSTALSPIAQAQALGVLGETSFSIPMPFENPIVLFESVRVAGTTHAPAIDQTMAEIPDDAPITLRREPDNQADPWAIWMEYNGKKIGYMPADKNEILARLMDGGKTLKAKLLSYELRDSWWRVYVQISLVD